MSTSVKKEEKKADLSGPVVLAVFRADCRGTLGPGSTLALVQGATGKCRLYGKDSLANAFPDSAAFCRSLTTPERMADHFGVSVATGKVACVKFLAEHNLQFAGPEEVLGDVGSGHKRNGRVRSMDFAAFALFLCLMVGCTLSKEGVGWQGAHGGYFACFVESDCNGF